MTAASLTDVLLPAMANGTAVAGLVVLGWEDARAYVAAAEAEGLPIILQAGPGCRAHTPLPVLGAMFRHLAEGASVPVVTHLDHGTTDTEARMAIDCGFTSVMFDGSRLPLSENIDATARIVEIAHRAGVSCEGEIGFVGYAGGAQGTGTNPAEAAVFATATGVDAMAISVGNVHLQTAPDGTIDRDHLRGVQQACPGLPLVLHGGSGLPEDTRRWLARNTNVCKINIGTELRQAFGAALRSHIAADPVVFDRIAILQATEGPVCAATRHVIRTLADN